MTPRTGTPASSRPSDYQIWEEIQSVRFLQASPPKPQVVPRSTQSSLPTHPVLLVRAQQRARPRVHTQQMIDGLMNMNDQTSKPPTPLDIAGPFIPALPTLSFGQPFRIFPPLYCPGSVCPFQRVLQLPVCPPMSARLPKEGSRSLVNSR